MTATCPVDGCGADILEALGTAGNTIPLNPRRARRGKFAAERDASGRWRARLLRPGEIPGDDEYRFNEHKCAGRGGGLAEVKREQSKAAHAARTQRGRYKPRPPLSQASGVRIPPPGDER